MEHGTLFYYETGQPCARLQDGLEVRALIAAIDILNRPTTGGQPNERTGARVVPQDIDPEGTAGKGYWNHPAARMETSCRRNC